MRDRQEPKIMTRARSAMLHSKRAGARPSSRLARPRRLSLYRRGLMNIRRTSETNSRKPEPSVTNKSRSSSYANNIKCAKESTIGITQARRPRGLVYRGMLAKTPSRTASRRWRNWSTLERIRTSTIWSSLTNTASPD